MEKAMWQDSIWTALIAGRGFPKDGVLRTSKIYSMMLMDWWWWSWMFVVVVIMIGGVLLIVWGYRCLANEVDVSKWPDGGGDQFSSDWEIRQLACHLTLHQLMHVCWNAECKSWKWVQQWRSEATKSWKGRWHTLAGQNILIFISSYYDVQKGFEQYICC